MLNSRRLRCAPNTNSGKMQGLYVNCLALQAVVDRWTTMSNEVQHPSTAGSTRPNSTAQTNSSTAANATASWRVLMEQYQVNEPYIQEVVDASRRILKTVLDGLLPGNSLKHAPVRTFFRILSGMIFILKVRCDIPNKCAFYCALLLSRFHDC